MSCATPSMPIESYLYDEFVPRHLASVSPKSINKYSCAVRRAAEFLGRTPATDDLSDSLITGLSDWLSAQGMMQYRVQVYRQCLRAIAADAQQHGYQTGWVSTIDPLAKAKGAGNRRQKFKRDTRGPQAKTRRQLVKAAALFAGGLKLSEVADRLGVPLDTLGTWRKRHRTIWDAAYQRASQAVVESVRVEAGKRAETIRQAAFMQRATAAEGIERAAGRTMVNDPGDSGEAKRVGELIVDMGAERAWQQNTARQYVATLKSMERWSGRVLSCHEFNAAWVNQYLAELDASHLAKQTVRNRRVQLAALWRAAFDEGLCPLPPQKVRRIKLVQRAPEAWSVDEVELLLAQAAQREGHYHFKDPATGEKRRMPRAAFWRLFVRVLWDTGLRIGDVGKNGILHLTQGKTGRWHVCRLHASTLSLLAELRMPRRSRLLPWDKSENYLRVEFRERILKSTGLAGCLKKLRKSSASDVELNYPGMGAVHLGHRLSASIAHNHYLDPRIVAKNRPMPTELTGDSGANAIRTKGGAT